MKNEEDEAFDDIARKQGAWGGGFKAKQAMAKARVEDDDDIQDYKRQWVDLTDEEIDDAYVAWDDIEGASFADFARDIERLLKEKNT
jgi:hypothetical protein